MVRGNAATNPVHLYCFMGTAGQRLLPFIIPAKQETCFLIIAAKPGRTVLFFAGKPVLPKGQSGQCLVTARVEGEIVHDGRELSLLAAAKKQTLTYRGLSRTGWYHRTVP